LLDERAVFAACFEFFVVFAVRAVFAADRFASLPLFVFVVDAARFAVAERVAGGELGIFSRAV
jgi:hypothetical protein